MLVKALAKKEIFKNGDFRIISCSPITPYPNELKLTSYFNFVIKGSNIPFITIGREYDLEIEEINTDKYGTSYNVIDCPSLNRIDFHNLTREESLEILMDCTSSERIANNILDAIPNYIEKVLTEGEKSIDTSLIKGVGEAYNRAYCRELLSKYKYYSLMKRYKTYALDTTDCKALYDLYTDDATIDKEMNKHPYKCLINDLNRTFSNMDSLILSEHEELRNSEERCTFCILDILQRNEYDGSTRLNGNVMYTIMKKEYNVPELLPMVVDVCKNSDLIYYDEESKDLSIMATYLGECNICEFVNDKLNNSTNLDIDWTKYTEVDGFKLTDEQSNALKNLCDYDISLLLGYSGCVDKDTEFFNGKEWKKISEYNNEDLVLQWNKDGSANLVKPLRYIKAPCDKMYHFETKYGLNQTLSPEHRVVYINKKTGKLEEKTMQEVYDRHYDVTKKTGFDGKFMTTFKYDGKGINLTDEEIKLMCAIICDGTFYYNVTNKNVNSYKTCRFHIKKERKKIALRNLFKEADIEWREKESSADGYTDFYIQAPRREKEFSEYWYNCSQHQLQIICDNLIQWDGNIDKTPNGIERKSFSTNVLNTANFVQFAYTACGYRATINVKNRIGRKKINKTNGKEYEDKTLEYKITITKRNLCSLSFSDDKTNIVEIKPEDGYKYCFTVPSSYLVLRRNNHIFITGNCGKTSSVKGLVALCEDNNLSYTLLAPTGKASMRMSESVHRSASTIHRKVLRDGEINSDVIIVDECSMIDLETFNMLINAITNNNSKIVLVGDNAQLMPVGIGCIFNDIINSNKVPMTMLTEVFRYNSSGSLYVATNVRQGKPFFDNNDPLIKRDGNVLKVGNNYKFIESENIFDDLIKEYMNLINKGVKPSEILCLSPFNVGNEGTYAINNAIQDEINAPKPNENILTRKISNKNIVFRLGDRILNKKNDYNALPLDSYKMIENDELGILTEDTVPLTSIFNGQDGVIRQIDEKKIVAQFDEELIVFNKGKLNNLLLAYCISVHSSQGSEAKYVINVVSNKHSRMLNRNLLYVADTRSKEMQIDIGSSSAYENALLVDGNQERYTWLKELLLNK